MPLQWLVDHLLNQGAYGILKYPKQVERRIRQATGANYVYIYDCIDANRARFQPKMWDEMLRLRILESYNPPDELLVYFHRTQEEIDEEAEGLDEWEYQIYLFLHITFIHWAVGVCWMKYRRFPLT